MARRQLDHDHWTAAAAAEYHGRLETDHDGDRDAPNIRLGVPPQEPPPYRAGKRANPV
jgi:hypothetical protein